MEGASLCDECKIADFTGLACGQTAIQRVRGWCWAAV